MNFLPLPLRLGASRSRTLGRHLLTGLTGALMASALIHPALAQAEPEGTHFALESATILDIQAAFDAGALTSEQLVRLYLARIASYDDHGPALNAVITVNPDALELARQLDAERAESGSRGPLHGIPVLLKDNYNTDDMPTTGGSVTLEGSIPAEDAFTVAQLRAQGAIILGKTNLSEYATPAGRGAYSSINSYTKNPFRPESDPSGSSGGSGAATAANFATVTLGTDTGGSIRGPAAANGVVGIRPTYGLISRSGIIPQALTMDTAGPLARSVTDAAIIIGALAGEDAADPTTAESDTNRQQDYTQFLDADALQGARIGVVGNFSGGNAEVDALFGAAIADLESLGAEAVAVSFDPEFLSSLGGLRSVINAEFGPDLEDYLAALPGDYPKTLEEVVAIYESPEVLNSPRPVNPGLVDTHKTNIEIADKTDPEYLRIVGTVLPEVRATVEAFMDEHDLEALVWPTSLCTAAPRYGLEDADHLCESGPNPSLIATYTGFPDIQVPVGYTERGLPSTMSFVGRAYSEPSLIGFAYAYEQATMHRVAPELFPALAGEEFDY